MLNNLKGVDRYNISLEKGEFEYIKMMIENMKFFYEKDLENYRLEKQNNLVDVDEMNEEIEFLEIEIERINYILEILEHEKGKNERRKWF